jgi:hypothetical protein
MHALDGFGIITVATGSPEYHEMAKAVARSLEHAGVRLPRAVVVDRSGTGLEAFFHHVIETTALPRNFQSKLHLGPVTPFERSLFIDVDCLVYEQFHAQLHQAARTPVCAPGELIAERDWIGVTPQLIERLAGGPRPYRLLHSGLFSFDAHKGASVLKLALELEPEVAEALQRPKPISADVLLSIACAVSGHADHWAKDPSFLSPSLRWTAAPRLDIVRRQALTFPNGRATSARIVHFMGEQKSGRTYARERSALAALLPTCDLRTSLEPDTWHAGSPQLAPSYHVWTMFESREAARGLSRRALARARSLAQKR